MTGRPSLWRCYSDLFWAWVLLGLAPSAKTEMSPADHRLLCGCYATIAGHWRRWGRTGRAARLDAKAARHAEAAGDGELPPAASMGLPRRPRIVVDARGTVVRGPWRDDGPRSLYPRR